jgi:hypothetical protein
METVDYSGMIVTYNFVIGVLIMLSSEKLGSYAGLLNKAHRLTIGRLTRVTTFTFGACVAVVAGSVYVVFHMLRFNA